MLRIVLVFWPFCIVFPVDFQNSMPLHEMADDRLIGENWMDPDLNQEPLDPAVGSVERFGFLLNELESGHGRIEERIQQLEAVTARARQRQRWQHARSTMEMSHVLGDFDDERDANGIGNLERGKNVTRGSSHLIAKALEMIVEVKKVVKEGGSLYDCNICFHLAKEPVLTCCGHLFCWACFHQVSYIDSTCKECPVCEGEVSDGTVTPIYGNGSVEHDASESISAWRIPPRPKARRIESLRQQCLSRGQVAEAVRRIRIGFDAMDYQTQPPVGRRGVHSLESGPQEVENAEFSRVLSESPASLSSAMSSTGRLVEDVEAVVDSRFLQDDDARALSVDVGNQLIMQSYYHPPLEQSSEVDSTLLFTSPFLLDLNLQVAASSSSQRRRRRRNIMARIYDDDRSDSRESSRRRLN